MSKAAYPSRNATNNKNIRQAGGSGNEGGGSATRARKSSANLSTTHNEVVADIDDVTDYDYDYPLEEQPVGLLSTPGRAIALGSSVVLLIIIMAVVVWLMASRAANSSVTVSTAGLSEAPNVGALAPHFSLLDVHTDQPVSLAALRGKPVWINFWGTWCPPCRGEMPEMQKMYNKYNGQIDIIGVSTLVNGDDPGKVKNFVDAAHYSWTFIHDPDYSVANRYGVMSIPSSFFIDRNGVIRAEQVGALNNSMMENFIQQIR